MTAIQLAIVGFGKIVRTRHVPAIAATPGIELTAVADPNATPEDVPHFATLDELLT